MSYGADFLSKERDKKATIETKRSYSSRKVEEEGIVTSHLPAYTDILKIRLGCWKLEGNGPIDQPCQDKFDMIH